MQDRRQFLGSSFAFGAAAALQPDSLLPSCAPKKILILGGTGFLGPHQVRRALERGHQVTIFNRGRSGAGMFGKDVEELRGDRMTDLSALRDRKWDVVIDESASRSDAPQWVEKSATLLQDAVEQYVFVSTRSVYLDFQRVPMTADAEVLTRENSPLAEGRALPYGHAKAYAEKAAHKAMPGRVTVVRPGLIIGPEDDTDRFTYWPVRIARGGEVLVPGDGSDHVQIIDVRDLAAFQIKLAEDRTFGVFNAVGPHLGQTFKSFVEAVRKGTGSEATFAWVDADFLIENKAMPYGRELPVFQRMRDKTIGFAQFDLTKEKAAGLVLRSTEDSARDTLAWWKTLPAERQAALKTGFEPEREAALLAKFAARK